MRSPNILREAASNATAHKVHVCCFGRIRAALHPGLQRAKGRHDIVRLRYSACGFSELHRLDVGVLQPVGWGLHDEVNSSVEELLFAMKGEYEAE